MIRLLQELQDLKDYKYCLSKDLYKTYKQYLTKKCLKEVRVNSILDLFNYRVYKHPLEIEERFNVFLNGFQQIDDYDRNRDEKGNLTKIPTYMTHLQNNKKEPCTKEEFRRDIYQFELDKQMKASELIEKFLKMFDDEGWLIIN